MIVSLTDIFIVLSCKISKAEIGDFSVDLNMLIKRHGLGYAHVNKLDKLHTLLMNDPSSFLFLHLSTKIFDYIS